MDLQGYLPTVFLLKEVFGYSPDESQHVMRQYEAEVLRRAEVEAEGAAIVKHVIEDASEEEIDNIVSKATGFKRFGINSNKFGDGPLEATPSPTPVPYDEERGE